MCFYFVLVWQKLETAVSSGTGTNGWFQFCNIKTQKFGPGLIDKVKLFLFDASQFTEIVEKKFLVQVHLPEAKFCHFILKFRNA